MKRVLVTGGTGFIGSHLVKRLVDSNIEVTVADINFPKKSFFYLGSLDKKTKVINCDVRNFSEVRKLIDDNKIDFIFHLAALPIVEDAYEKPLATFETNIIGTANVLEAARKSSSVSGILVTSSDKAYGKIPRVTEKNPLAGNHPYEVSKSAADLISTTYFKTYGLPVVVTRFGNVYGEGDVNFDRIVPGIMRSLVTGSELLVRSDGKYIRDYVYVGDVVDAMMMLAKKRPWGEAFNISSTENLSVIDLIHQVEKILDKKVKYKILNIAKNEISIQSVDFSKIKKQFGWEPKYSLAKTVSQIFEWYEKKG